MANERLTAALDYATRGWYVVPLNPQSKVISWEMCHKLEFMWNLDQPAPTDADIRHWFKLEPDINIGIRMAGSGLAVFDVDEMTNIHKIPGFEGNGLPCTPTVQTARGLHVLVGDFLTTWPATWAASVPAYVVAPPSRHPDMFTYYQWMITPDVPLADVPDWLLAAVEPPLPPSSWFADMSEWDEDDEAIATDFEWDDEDSSSARTAGSPSRTTTRWAGATSACAWTATSPSTSSPPGISGCASATAATWCCPMIRCTRCAPSAGRCRCGG